MSKLFLPIIAEFKGQKAFKDAGKATNSLEKGVKKLGASLLAAFSVTKITQFGKAASKAFIEDQKAANRLAIAVKNLGLEFQSPAIEKFISDLSAMSGVTDDQLRPSMQRLLQTTGSVTKAQALLTQALDISAGSGVDYETVVNDLSMAYVGQTRGLRKYNLGLTQAELKTASFADVQARLNKQFSGANADFLTTYAGKLQLITTAAGEASEKIGGALVDSLVSVFAAGDTTVFVTQIDALATKIANVVNSVVFGFQKLYVLTSDRAILASLNPFDNYEKNALAAIEAAERAAKFRLNAPAIGYQGSQPMNIYETSAAAAKRLKSERDAAKRAKELAALTKKGIDTQRRSNALTKAGTSLDLDRISITAALRGKISETDRLSLNLQLALLDKNEEKAKELSARLDAAIKRNNELAAALLATPKAPNPFRDWAIPKLDYGGNVIGAPVPGFTPPSFTMPPSALTSSGQTVAELITSTAESLGTTSETVLSNAASLVAVTDATSELIEALLAAQAAGVKADAATAAANNIFIKVEVDGTEIASSAKTELTNQSLSGSFVNVNRLGRFAQLATPQ